MRFRYLAATAALMAASFTANAQPIDGLYVSLGGGLNIPGRDRSVRGNTPTLGIVLPSRPQNVFGTGGAGTGSVGWGFGNGLRVEGEFAYREDSVLRNVSGPVYTGDERKYSFMGNVLYDFDFLHLPVVPYVGAGAGMTIVSWNPVNRILNGIVCCTYFGSKLNFNSLVDVTNLATDSDMVTTVQGIVGLKIPTPIPGLGLTLEYRLFDQVHNLKLKNFLTISPEHGPEKAVSGYGTTTYSRQASNTVFFGMTYAFNTPTPPPPAAIVPVSAPAAVASRTYLLFFDWDRSDLTDRAKQIVKEAADASARVSFTHIRVNGYTDASGTPKYNEGLSLRRAQTVAAELIRDGVPRTAIEIKGFGQSNPLVPTAAGVREPQNRRVLIEIQ